MKHYEVIYIVNPNLGDEDYKEVIKKFNDLVEKGGGTVVKVKEWGKQRLAYDIKKFDKGAYVHLEYCAKPGGSAEFEREFKLDDRILKFQTVKLADEVDPEELIGKKEDAKKEAPAEESEAQSETPTAQETGTTKTEEVRNGV